MVRNISKSGEIVIWNKFMERMSGVDATEAVGKTFEDFYFKNIEKLREYDKKTCDTESPVEFIEHFPDVFSGESRVAQVFKTACRINADETYVIDLSVDVTQLEKAKIEAQEANKSQSLFLATITHELRTPLNAVLSFGKLLQQGGEDEKERESYIRSINIAGDALLNLINDILDLSKISLKCRSNNYLPT